ncbi:hypothetical protein P3L10_024674 [Capsicum annuum]
MLGVHMKFLIRMAIGLFELELGPTIPVHAVLHDWIRHTDGKLSFLGFVKLLHGALAKAQ